MDRPTRYFFAAVSVLAFLLLVPFSIDRLAAYSFDDACYYARIAENVAHGYGLTFDRINPTNGFQPLWLLALIPVHALPFTPETNFFLGLILQIALLTTASFLLFGTLARLMPGVMLLPSAVVFGVLAFLPSVNGMETAIQLLGLVGLFAFGYRAHVFERPGTLRSFAFGLLMAIVMLARLDDVFLAGVLGSVLLVRALTGGPERASRLRHLILIGAGAVLGVTPYLVFNAVAFGAIMPISGQLKSSFPHPQWTGSLLAQFGWRGLGHIAAAVVILVWAVRRRSRIRASRFEYRYLATSAVIGAVALLLHATHTMFFMQWAAFRWHFIWYALSTSIIMVFLIEEVGDGLLERHHRVVFATVGILCVLGAGFMIVRKMILTSGYVWQNAAYEAALWTRNHVPEDAVMAMHDAGVFGYFSRRRVVNLDGLVNTPGYQDSLRDERWAEYLRSRGVTYIVKHDFGDIDYGDTVDIERYRAWSYRVKSHLYDAWSDSITLQRRNEVYRGRVYDNGGKRVVTAIWRWSDDPKKTGPQHLR